MTHIDFKIDLINSFANKPEYSFRSNKIVRKTFFEIKGNICEYCGRTIKKEWNMCIDHIKASSKGGSNKFNNLALACRRCNSIKRDRSVQELWKSEKFVNWVLEPKDIY